MNTKLLPILFHVVIFGCFPTWGKAAACQVEDPIKSSSEITFISEAGTATMIGFDEFGTASNPPKKFRRKVMFGTMYTGEWSLPGCPGEGSIVNYSGGFPPTEDWWANSTGSAQAVPVEVDSANNRVKYRLTSRSFTNLTTSSPWGNLWDIRLVAHPADSSGDTIWSSVGQEFWLNRATAKNPHEFFISGYWSLAGWIGHTQTKVSINIRNAADKGIRDEWDSDSTYGADGTGPTVNSNHARNVGVGVFPLTSGGTAESWTGFSSSPASAYGSLVTTTNNTSTGRTYAGTESCVGTAAPYTKAKGTIDETLDVEDTEEDAEARATPTSGTSNTAYRTDRGSSFTWSFQEVKYETELNPTCPGDYEIFLYYSTKPHGSAGPITPRIEIKPQRLKAGLQTVRGSITIQEKGVDYTLDKIEAWAVCPDSQVSESNARQESVHFNMSLGRGPASGAAGWLLLDSDTIAAAIYTPASLTVAAVANDTVEVIRDGSSVLRQVKVPQALVDVVVTDSDTYEVRFYALTDVGAQDPGTKIYAVSGTPFATYQFDNPDTGVTERLRITETRGANSKVTEYAYNSTTATWSLKHDGNLRQEFLAETTVGGDTVKTTTIKDASNATVSVRARTYHTYAWGEELIREVLDPAGAALTTEYVFYDNESTDGDNYGRLKLRTNPDGSWERHTWDAEGRPLKTVRPFLNAVSTAADNLCRVEEHTYGTLADGDGDSTTEKITTMVQSTLGVETARTYQVEWSKPVTLGGQDFARRTDTRCVAAGAAWNATANLVTESLFYTENPFIGRIRRVVNPDGTATLTAYVVDANGELTTTTKTGAPNGALDDIVDGRQVVTITNATGQVTEETVSDIASGLTLSTWVATEFDGLGRPTRLDYADGTYITRSYACCGLASERDRSGLVTSYGYDALGRQTTVTRQGILTTTGYDADGRVKSVSRTGTDSSVIVQQSNLYDLAGRQTESRDALNRLAEFAESFNATTGETTRTTTNPDLGTVIEVTARDGSRLSTAGTAAAPGAFEYGVESNELFTKEVRIGVDENNDPTDTEWSKTYADFAGRTYKTVYPDAATAQSYFNAVGQLDRQTDPDGVTTLYAYNSRGEQTTVGIDLDADDTIDLDGTDRVTRTVADVYEHGTVVVRRATTQVWETDNNATPTTVAVQEQDGYGRNTWSTVRGLTNSTTIAFDGSGGRTATATAPDGTGTVQVFAGDRLASVTVSAGTTGQLSATTYAYDEHGRLETVTDARNGATNYTYFADDQIETVTTPDPDTGQSGAGYDPQVTTYAYDTAGRVSTVTHPDGGVVNTTYWPTGQLKRTWGARAYPVEYAYDPQGRVRTLQTWRDFTGNTGQAVTTWDYDPVRGWLTAKRHADDEGPSYTYTAAGRIETRTWARTPAVTTTYSYNDAGEVTGVDYSDATPDVTIAYDRLGRPKQMTDGAGTRALTYHASGQVDDEDYTAGLLDTLGVHRTFDGYARLETLAAVVGATTVNQAGYAYGDGSRLGTVTQETNTATYGYVTNSALVETVTFKQSGTARLTTTKTHDNLNRLSSVTNTPSSTSTSSFNYLYNAANQRTRATREDDSYWAYGYDALGQVTSGQKHLADTTAVPGLDHAWTFDDIGNRKTATVNDQAATYTANSVNQYTQRTVPGVLDVLGSAQADATVTVTFPASGGTIYATTRQDELYFKQLSVTNTSAAQYPALKVTAVLNDAGPNGEDVIAEDTRNAFVAQTPEAYGHDADGNLTADSRWTYVWDAENRLMAMETVADAVTAGVAKQKLEFIYDGQSRRVAKKVYSWSGSAWVLDAHTLYLYDGWNMIAELDALASNAAIRTYVWGLDLSGTLQGAGGVGGLLFTNPHLPSANSHAPAYDGNGNVIALVDMVTGVQSGTYDYNAFGETAVIDGAAAMLNPYRFSTKYQDDETGLYYYGYRFYDPHSGRWLSRDPIQERGGVNVYGMVGNDPTNRVDPLGLFATPFGPMDPYLPGMPGYNPNAYIPGWGVELSAAWDYLVQQIPKTPVASFSRSGSTPIGLVGPTVVSLGFRISGKVQSCCSSTSGGNHLQFSGTLALTIYDSIGVKTPDIGAWTTNPPSVGASAGEIAKCETTLGDIAVVISGKIQVPGVAFGFPVGNWTAKTGLKAHIKMPTVNLTIGGNANIGVEGSVQKEGKIAL